MKRKMRDSTKPWIGEIPSYWEVKRIKGIIQPSKDGIKIGPFGSALTNKTIGEGEFNVYSQANLIAGDFSSTKNTIDSDTFGELKNYEVFPDDICLSMMGTIGKCKKVPAGIRRGIMDSHLIKIRLAESVDSRFFEYVYDKDFSGVCFAQMQYDKKGFIMDGLNTSIVKNLYFPLPPLDEQRRISDFLDAECSRIDAIIEQTRSSIEEYKKLKQSVITQAVTKGIRPNRKMKDSGVEWIGEIPEEWDVGKAKYYVVIGNGSDPKTEGDIPVYGSGANSFKTCGEFKIGPAVLIGRKGATLHIPHYINHNYWNVDTAFDVKACEGFDLKYYFYLACCFDYKLYISQTTLPGMTQSNYENMSLPVPNKNEQVEIVAWLDNKTAEIDGLIQTKGLLLQNLLEYKQSLIYEYVTGKKEVV